MVSNTGTAFLNSNGLSSSRWVLWICFWVCDNNPVRPLLFQCLQSMDKDNWDLVATISISARGLMNRTLFIVWNPLLRSISEANLSKSFHDKSLEIFMTSAPKLTATIDALNLSVAENERRVMLWRLPTPLSNRNFNISFATVTLLIPANSLKPSKVIFPSLIAQRQSTMRVAFGHN